MIFWRRFGSEGRTRQFTIEHGPKSGWIAREQYDTSVRTNLMHDWRHVELAIVMFEIKSSMLRSQGWAEQAQPRG